MTAHIAGFTAFLSVVELADMHLIHRCLLPAWELRSGQLEIPSGYRWEPAYGRSCRRCGVASIPDTRWCCHEIAGVGE